MNTLQDVEELTVVVAELIGDALRPSTGDIRTPSFAN
jgi:hypothetical protein